MALVEMSWNDFLSWRAFRCHLNSEASDFFEWAFQACHLALSRADLAIQYGTIKHGVTEDSCIGYLTEIYSKVGHGNFEKPNRKFKELYYRLFQEFNAIKLQSVSRSLIPSLHAEDLNQFLKGLNYREQERHVEDFITQPTAAFLVRINDLAMQQWLVWRLVEGLREKTGDQEKLLPLTVKASGQWSSKPELFWEWLASNLSCGSKEPKDLLEHIVQSCRDRSIVFVVHEFDDLKQDVQKLILDQFWFPLVERLTAQRQVGDGKCRLFLTGDCDDECIGDVTAVNVLTAWKTVDQNEEMRPWLENRLVREFLQDKTGLSQDELFAEWLGNERRDKPKKVVKQLAQSVGLEDGIDALRSYWQLAA